MSYVSLGSRPVAATADQTGLNAGNYTNAFPAGTLNINLAYFEIYHMTVNNVPVGAQATIYLNNRFYGFCYPNVGAEWNPAQPILMNAGDELDFCWDIAASGQAPMVTVYLRYDPLLNAGL